MEGSEEELSLSFEQHSLSVFKISEELKLVETRFIRKGPIAGNTKRRIQITPEGALVLSNRDSTDEKVFHPIHLAVDGIPELACNETHFAFCDASQLYFTDWSSLHLEPSLRMKCIATLLDPLPSDSVQKVDTRYRLTCNETHFVFANSPGEVSTFHFSSP